RADVSAVVKRALLLAPVLDAQPSTLLPYPTLFRSVRGSGDGGAVTTAADLAAFWAALLAGRIVSAATLEALLEPVSVDEEEEMRYARGFWRGLASEEIRLEGYDAGVSARTWHDPRSGITASGIANHSDGAWPVLVALEDD